MSREAECPGNALTEQSEHTYYQVFRTHELFQHRQRQKMLEEEAAIEGQPGALLTPSSSESEVGPAFQDRLEMPYRANTGSGPHSEQN